MFFIIKNSQDLFFNGFLSRHPGTEPRGTTEAEFLPETCRILSPANLEAAVDQLKELGITDFWICTVRTVRRA